MNGKMVAVCSGGLDSTVALYEARARGFEAHVLSFDYGQRHRKELWFAHLTCKRLGVDWSLVDLSSITKLLSSSLTFQGDVPEGHYAEETMKATVVPNRNAIMLGIAYGHAISLEALGVVIGAHAGDHPIYPDCRSEFFEHLANAFQIGYGSERTISIITPYIHKTKADIVKLGAELKVPFELTWSCYKGGEVHCGRCGTCVERAEAFHLAGVDDPTTYQDPVFWQAATAAQGAQNA